jgi:glycosyltransferase involved in cell wall biosynthesis
MANTLNQHGVETYYVYLGPQARDHDSTHFHYGDRSEPWDLSEGFQDYLWRPRAIVALLSQIKSKRHILHCFATGRNAYLLKKAGMKYKYWSYGSDIDQECFIRMPLSNTPVCKRFIKHPYRVISERSKARRSICEATSIMISPYQLERLGRICPGKRMFFLPHYFKTTDYQTLLEQKAQSKRIVCEQIRVERYFFSSTRHVWSGTLRDMADNKGNDVLLNSYVIFKKRAGDHQSKLVLVRKGPDVEASQSLSRTLGIKDDIVWTDEMRREELDRYYQGATICFGQFGSPVMTYSALEPLANGSISISLLSQNNSIVPIYKESPPIFSSKDPKEIAEFMVRVLLGKENDADLSYKSWLWIQNNCSEESFVKSFIKLFEDTDPS